MPLLNNQQAHQAHAAPASGEPKDPEAFKTMKKEAAKRHSDKRRKQIKTICDWFDAAKPHATPEVLAIISNWKNPRVGGTGNFGEPLFTKIFGATPKVGDKATLGEVVSRILKGVDKMNQLIKKWAENGTAVVEYVHNEANPLQSVYTIKSLG